MNKKDNITNETKTSEPPGSVAKTARPQNPVVATKGSKVTRAKRHKKAVKFANPLTEHRLYEKPVSPKDEIEQHLRVIKDQRAPERSTLNELKPPLSLVAQLDLAANKLNARPDTKSLISSSVKSSKSVRSSKSIAETTRESRSPAMKDNDRQQKQN